jgi:hypothetical protein
MDNAPIHTPAKVCDLVESSGLEVSVLATLLSISKSYRRILVKSKAGIKRNALRADDRLSDHMYQSVTKVIIPDKAVKPGLDVQFCSFPVAKMRRAIHIIYLEDNAFWPLLAAGDMMSNNAQ